MKKKCLLIFLLLNLSLLAFTEDNINTFFNLNFTINPILTENRTNRGTTLNLSRFLIQNFYIGASVRIMHEDYTSLFGDIGYKIDINSKLSIPISLGAGIGINTFDFDNITDDSLNTFLHGQTGLEWSIDRYWRYCLYGTYNYNLQDKLLHRIFINIGVLYMY